MAHFLETSAAKTLSLVTVFRMTDAEAETAFRKIRWSETDGAPVCPKCGGLDASEKRRAHWPSVVPLQSLSGRLLDH